MKHDDLTLSELALRERLEAVGQDGTAGDLATGIANSANDILNGQGISCGCSLVARAMTARAIVLVAASWMAEIMKAPEPACFRVLMSMLEDPPVGWESDVEKMSSEPK